VAGDHGWQGTLLSDRAGICDRQNCGRQAGEWCRLKAYYNITVQFVNQYL